jgi:hypothetical protein
LITKDLRIVLGFNIAFVREFVRELITEGFCNAKQPPFIDTRSLSQPLCRTLIIGPSLFPHASRAIDESPASSCGTIVTTQLWVDVGNGKKVARRFPLKDDHDQPIRTLSEAREALEIKRHERREDQLPTLGRKPSFADYCATYLAKAKVQRKRAGTLAGERQAIARWCDHLGHVRIDQIGTPLIAAYIDKRLKGATFCRRKLGPA